nr:MAG TPA: hypothetical protein [Bacteriophage sp.]
MNLRLISKHIVKKSNILTINSLRKFYDGN